MAKRKLELPPGARKNASSGRITLMFAVDEGGRRRRLSQNKILPTEPRSYATVEEADEGYRRVKAYLAEQADRATTVAGFWKRWTDEDDPEFGAFATQTPRRSKHAIYTYASHTRAFAEHYADRTVASLNEKDVLDWTRNIRYRASSMAAIRTFLSDAEKAGLRTGANPAAAQTKNAQAKLSRQRKTQPAVPTLEQSDAMLAFAKTHMPIGLYGWLLCGVRTGMRCAEIDGMQLRYLDRQTGVYDIQFQRHPRTGVLDEPKHQSQRKVLLTPDVLAVIDAIHPRLRDAEDPEPPHDFIWTGTLGQPWEDSSRLKWWEKTVLGTSLRAIAGDLALKNATRHYWATRAVNEGGISLWHAATLMGHKDGGHLIARTYARREEVAALDAMRAMQAASPISLQQERARRRS
jgi:integrase